MSTVTGINIDQAGSGYLVSNSVCCLNLDHGDCNLNTLFVDITSVNASGGVTAVNITDGKTGLVFSVSDLVYINSGDKQCILSITSVQP